MNTANPVLPDTGKHVLLEEHAISRYSLGKVVRLSILPAKLGKPSMRPNGGTLSECFALPGVLGGSEQGLTALFNSSVVGFVVCDSQLRFRAVNRALAKINRVPAKAHLGKTISGLLGNPALETPLVEVFASGKALANWNVEAQLRTRAHEARWIETYFPLKNAAGRVDHVGVILIEVPHGRDLASLSVQRRITSIRQCHEALGIRLARLSRNPVESSELTAVLAQSVELLEGCALQTETASKPRYEIFRVIREDQRCKRIVRTQNLTGIEKRLARFSSIYRSECFVRDAMTGAIVARASRLQL
jgi:hypothetical protein